MSGEPKLCYVEGSWAHFTTKDDVREQWGDDWNDAPYECNAGMPYEPGDRDLYGCKCYDSRGHKSATGQPRWIDGWRRYPWCGEEGHEPVPPKEPWEITKLAFDYGRLDAPEETGFNSGFSVRDINNGLLPWLFDRDWRNGTNVKIWAGTTIPEFKRLVREAGGEVYEPAKDSEAS